MNELWEAWVAQEVRVALKGKGWTLKTQTAKYFWQAEGRRKTVRPDLVLQPRGKDAAPLEGLFGIQSLKAITVLDTKWKVLTDTNPSDADLKQMYVYNKRWIAEQSWLLYPKVHDLNATLGSFVEDATHCGIAFVDLPTTKLVQRTA